MRIGEKLFNFIILYRSPSQSQDDFKAFLKNFELNLDTILTNHPFLTAFFVILISSLTFSLTVKRTSYEGPGIADLTFQFSEPTHLTKNSSSCTDLMFTSQPTLVMEPGLNSSLHKNCHHQIIYSNLTLKFILHLLMNGNLILSKSKQKITEKR